MRRLFWAAMGVALIAMVFAGCNQVDVCLKTQTQTADSLIVSITYTNNSSKRIILDGLFGISYEDYLPTWAQMNDGNDDEELKVQHSKDGCVCDTIKLILPQTKNDLRYQRLNNGDILDVFAVYSELAIPIIACPITPPELSGNDSIDFSVFFDDKSVFKLLWDNNAWSNNEFFDNENTYFSDYENLIAIEPHSSKSVPIDLSYLLKRKATYVIQILGEGPTRKGFDAKMIMKKKFGYKPYNKPFKSNTIVIVSD